MFINTNTAKVHNTLIFPFNNSCNDISHDNIQKFLELFDSTVCESYWYPNESLYDYWSGRKQSRKRKFLNFLITFIIMIYSFRCLLIAIINKPWIWLLFADPTHSCGDPVMINLNLFLMTFGIGLVMLSFQVVDKRILSKNSNALNMYLEMIQNMCCNQFLKKEYMQQLLKIRLLKYIKWLPILFTIAFNAVWLCIFFYGYYYNIIFFSIPMIIF